MTLAAHRRWNICPECGYFSDAVSAADGTDALPQPGDISICINCGASNIFTEGLTIRKLTVLDVIPEKKRARLELARRYAQARGPIPRKETKQ